MSVALAPRARIMVKASWPGVSRNTIGLPFAMTRYAPMCWVMPPASPSATFSLRIASRSDVLPWSTCPMTVTTGARGMRSPALAREPASSAGVVPAAVWSFAVCWRESSSSSSNETTAASTPNSFAISTATFGSSGWLIVAKTPRERNDFMRSFARTPSFSDSSLTVTPSERKTGPSAFFLSSTTAPVSVVVVFLPARRCADLESGLAARASSVPSPVGVWMSS